MAAGADRPFAQIILGELLGVPVPERDWPTAMVSAVMAQAGVDIVRVHRVSVTRLARQLMEAL